MSQHIFPVEHIWKCKNTAPDQDCPHLRKALKTATPVWYGRSHTTAIYELLRFIYDVHVIHYQAEVKAFETKETKGSLNVDSMAKKAAATTEGAWFKAEFDRLSDADATTATNNEYIKKLDDHWGNETSIRTHMKIHPYFSAEIGVQLSYYYECIGLNSLTDGAAALVCAEKKCKLPKLFERFERRVGDKPLQAQGLLLESLKTAYKTHQEECARNKPLPDLVEEIRQAMIRRRSQWDTSEVDGPSNDLSEEVKKSGCLRLECLGGHHAHMLDVQLCRQQDATRRNVS